MNLHGIAAAAIGAINPFIPVSIRVSAGATEDDSGRPIKAYAAPLAAMGQKQPVSGREIERFNQQGIQGVACKMYLNGNYEGMFRVLGKGGDMIDIPGEGQTYFVASVMERWPDWCCVALTMQNNASIK